VTASWSSKLQRDRSEHRTVLTTAFAGIRPGSVLYVSTPQRLDDELRAVPPGSTVSVVELRNRLAAVNDADATCPTTTSVFLRIVAEAALEQHAAGAPLDEVTPFWRVVDPDSALARKLGCGPGFIERRRARESTPAAADAADGPRPDRQAEQPSRAERSPVVRRA
jgi:hypothetical protein